MHGCTMWPTLYRTRLIRTYQRVIGAPQQARPGPSQIESDGLAESIIGDALVRPLRLGVIAGKEDPPVITNTNEALSKLEGSEVFQTDWVVSQHGNHHTIAHHQRPPQRPSTRRNLRLAHQS